MCACMTERYNIKCVRERQGENLLLSLVLDIASWEYNYMGT